MTSTSIRNWRSKNTARRLGLSAEMDALPIDETNSLAWASIRTLLRRARAHVPPSEALSHIRKHRIAGWDLNVRLRRQLPPEGQHIALSNGDFIQHQTRRGLLPGGAGRHGPRLRGRAATATG